MAEAMWRQDRAMRNGGKRRLTSVLKESLTILQARGSTASSRP